MSYNHLPRSQGKYRQVYSQEAVAEAVSKVRNNELNASAAAKLFRVPRSTIRSRLDKSEQNTFRSGRTALTAEEEEKLVQWVVDSQCRGLPVTKDQLAESVKEFLDANPRSNTFKGNRPGI